MNREIKFRAWDAQSNTMYDGATLHQIGGIMRNSVPPTATAKYQLMFNDLVFLQFTGMKTYFEGDILDLPDGPAKIVYVPERASFECVFADEANISLWEATRWGRQFPAVMGNIYQQPELLK